MSSIFYTPKQNRIQFVDALRGFALAGIILLHNIQHFNLGHNSDISPEWLQKTDQIALTAISFLFSGKAYAIFSLLFGFSFWIQYSHRKDKGKSFSGRFIWRMLLLFGFGIIHTIFYNGDILSFYALFSIVLILTRKWSDSAILFLSIFFLIQPLEWVKFTVALQNPSFQFHNSVEVYNEMIDDARMSGSFLELVKQNFGIGQLANIGWVWEYGRCCQVPGLFLLGTYFARKKMFSEISPKKWKIIGALSSLATLTSIAFSIALFTYTREHSPLAFAGIALWMYSSLFMTLLMLSILCLCWYYYTRFQKTFGLMAPYGRMSLTGYVSQSAIGTFIYFGYGLGLYKYCGPTLSMGIGSATLALQILFAHWWLKNHKQGPLEYLWKKATWVGVKKQSSNAPVTEAAQA